MAGKSCLKLGSANCTEIFIAFFYISRGQCLPSQLSLCASPSALRNRAHSTSSAEKYGV